jgi:hypothetical protein
MMSSTPFSGSSGPSDLSGLSVAPGLLTHAHIHICKYEHASVVTLLRLLTVGIAIWLGACRAAPEPTNAWPPPPPPPDTASPDPGHFWGRGADTVRMEAAPAGLQCAPPSGVSNQITVVVHPITLAPARQGPRVADMPPLDLPRGLPVPTDGVGACYRRVRIGPKPAPAQLDLDWRADAWGAITAHVTPGAGANDELAACVGAALAARPFDLFSPRISVAKLTIVIDPDAASWPVAPEPSDAATSPVRGVTGCAQLAAELPVDDLTPERPIHVAAGLRPAQPPPPLVPRPPSEKAYRAFIEFDRGTLQGCYADAIELLAGLTGEVQLELTIEQTGRVRDATLAHSSAHDPTVEGCLRAAALELRFTPSRFETHLVVPFTLAAGSPATSASPTSAPASDFAKIAARFPWMDSRAAAIPGGAETFELFRVPERIGAAFAHPGWLALARQRLRERAAPMLEAHDERIVREYTALLYLLARLRDGDPDLLGEAVRVGGPPPPDPREPGDIYIDDMD